MGDNQLFGKKKKVLEVPFELIWDPSKEDKENAGGNNGGQSELTVENISRGDENDGENLDSKTKKGSKSKKSCFSKLRRRSRVKCNEKICLESNDIINEAENNQKNVQIPSEVQEDCENTESTECVNKLNSGSTFPEEVDFLEYVDKVMIGLKLQESIEVDEITEEQGKKLEEDENLSLSYIRDELNCVKEQEDALDKVAEILEPELRATMDATDEPKKTSDQLLKDWFSVVAKRHSLLERKFQLLRALENGDHFELELRTDDVKQQLHILMKIPEHQKTSEQHKRQDVLWRELIELVNKRDEIVQVEEENRRLSSSSCSEYSPVEETPPRKSLSPFPDKRRRWSLF